jgi:hypothetical protein
MDRPGLALAQGRAAVVPRSLRAVAYDGDAFFSTLYARARGCRSIEAKAQSQQYLIPFDGKAMIELILEMFDLRTLVRNDYML